MPQSNYRKKRIKANRCNNFCLAGTLVTLVIVSVNENSAPPIFVFPWVIYRGLLTINGPASCIGTTNVSGWMSEKFYRIREVSVNITKCTRVKPILLLLDNNESHVLMDWAGNCKEYSVILLSFSPPLLS